MDSLCEGTMYVLIMLTGMFALRCSEAAMLTRENIQLGQDPPRIIIPPEPGCAKSPGDIPIMPCQHRVLENLFSEG